MGPNRGGVRRLPSFVLAGSAAMALFAVEALAQDAASGRYRMEKTENGILRLDTQTGEMSVCAEKAGQVVCELAPDDRKALNEQITELATRVDKLESRLAELEKDGARPEPDKLPSDQELDQVFGMMERFLHRFMGVFRDLDREYGNDRAPGSGPSPDRT